MHLRSLGCGLSAVVMLALIARFTNGEAATVADENLARIARVTADSEHSASYRAQFVCDGEIPAAGSRADVNKAWCVQGETHRNGAMLVFEWPEEVTVAEVVYFGRTAWFAEECWKDYRLFIDDETAPALEGRLAMGHGAQRLPLAEPRRARKLVLKFVSSYGGLNPGASEVQIYAAYRPDRPFGKFRPLGFGTPEDIPEEEVAESQALAQALRAGELGWDQLVMIRRHEIEPTHVYTYHVEGFRAGGGLGVYSVRTGEWNEIVSSPEGQILDSDISYDGREILFSWRRSALDGYHLFAVAADGTGLRQLTSGAWHDYNACWLPDGGIAFLSTREARFAYCWVSPVGVLHRMEKDGTGVRRLSANLVNDFTPSVLEDGRIIYSRWEYVDKPAIPIQSLWTIRPDGTGLGGFFGNRVLSPATFMEARGIPGSTRVLCTLTSHNGPARGAIGIIDRRHGNNAQEGIVNVTPWIRIGGVDRGDGNNIRGPYENPYPVDGKHFLVSRRGTVLLRDYAGTESVTVAGPRLSTGFYSPQPLRARPSPPVLSVVQGKHPEYEGPEWATVVLQNVYAGLEPEVNAGEVTQIAVVEEMRKAVRTDVANRAFGFQFPVISCGATYAAKRVWGFAPVAADGSACFQVPAGVPIYFMALDAAGRAVQRMRTFTHLMPGEVQGCVGCHESRHSAPLARPAPSLTREPDRLEAPDWGVTGFDYARVVQPVLDRHCAECHTGAAPEGAVDLSGDKTDFFNVSYETLARGRKIIGEGEWDSPYVNWIPTYNGMEKNILEITPRAWGSPKSVLADVLLRGHPDKEGKARVQMTVEERRRILTWIDLNVPYYGTSETAYPNNAGCRRIYPATLEATLAEVAVRRCAECHAQGKLPRKVWTRITHPELNSFLTAPLAKAGGGSERCGRPTFATREDPDYVAILRSFDGIAAQLARRPRMDMEGATPALDVDRSCLGSLQK